MKIWNGFGSEHSMNLVLIGRFANAREAERVEDVIKKIAVEASKEESIGLAFAGPSAQRFSDEMLDTLMKLQVHTVRPEEVEQFISEHHLEREDSTITVTTDEVDVSAFIKVFVGAGARVEVFSAHHHPAN